MTHITWVSTVVLAGALTAPPLALAQPPAAASDAARAVAQPAPVAAPAVVPDTDAGDKRRALRQVLEKYPPGVARVLKSDPTLLTNPAYLAQYPLLAAFLAQHPEVAHNPSFYFEHVYVPGDVMPDSAEARAFRVWENFAEGLTIAAFVTLAISTLMWVISRGLEHRRWLRVSRSQNDVHNKLLDRFAGSGELIAYVQSPAGRRFLEAAPIAVDAQRGVAAPMARILWSLQAGIVLIFTGFGMQWMAGQVTPVDAAQGFRMLGILGLSLGFGFVVSAVASYVLSRRLGLIDPAVRVDAPSDGMA